MSLESLRVDETHKGRRVELVYTSDPYTRLKPGDRGVYQYSYQNLDQRQHSIKWDSGSTLSLIAGEDQFKFVEDENAGPLDKFLR